MIRLKDGIDINILREFGFKSGAEWRAADEPAFGDHCGQDNAFYKFYMDPEQSDRIYYIDEDTDVATCEMSFITGTDGVIRLFIDAAPSCTYHIDTYDWGDIVEDIIYDLAMAGAIEKC